MLGIMIVEDSPFTMEYLELELLKEKHKYEVLCKFRGIENVELACESGRINIVLMDVCLGEKSGLELAKKIKEKFPSIKVIIMTSMMDQSFIKQAKISGCDGFWFKESITKGILPILEEVEAGGKMFVEDFPDITLGNAKLDELTEAELAVLRSFAKGCTYAEVAEDCHISQNTVRYHVKNLTSKTGMHNMAKIALEAVDKRVILPRF
jgi:hypothetical protein